MRRLTALAVTVMATTGCDKAAPVAPVDEVEVSIPTSNKFAPTVGTFSGEAASHVTRWSDPSPVVVPQIARPRPNPYPVVKMPEFCDNAALRETQLALRQLNKVGHRTITKIETAQCHVKGRVWRGGYVTLTTRDARGRWDNSTRRFALPRHESEGMYPGDYIVSLGRGLFRIVPIEEFDAEFAIDDFTLTGEIGP